MSSNRGTTLLEIVITCALIALVLGTALPNFRALSAPYALRTATEQIAGDFQFARMRAIARNASYRLVFAPDGYTVEGASAGPFVAEGGRRTLPPGASIGTVSPGTPVFNTRGMLAATVTVPVTVTGLGTKTVSVNVLGQTTIQ